MQRERQSSAVHDAGDTGVRSVPPPTTTASRMPAAGGDGPDDESVAGLNMPAVFDDDLASEVALVKSPLRGLLTLLRAEAGLAHLSDRSQPSCGGTGRCIVAREWISMR